MMRRAHSLVWLVGIALCAQAPAVARSAAGDAYAGLPPGLIGAWVPKGEACPSGAGLAARSKTAIWVGPHAIEREGGACWLIGDVKAQASEIKVEALCPSGRGFKRRSFTFDQMSGQSVRVRPSDRRRLTYGRCTAAWRPDPVQNRAAASLSGTHGFVFDIHARMRNLQGKAVDGSHARKIELKLHPDGTLADRMQIDGSATHKRFEARFGEVVIDSDGDRVTWLVRGGRLLRASERKGYYELISWPLQEAGGAVPCKAELALLPTRRDGKLRSVAADGAVYDVITAEIKVQRCPDTPLSFEVARKPKHASSKNEIELPSDRPKRIKELPAWAKAAEEAGGCFSTDPEVAIEACSTELAGSAGTARALPLTNRANAYAQKGMHEKAIADYTAALRIDPNNASAFRNRGLVYLKQKNYALALADLDRAIDLESAALRKPYGYRARTYVALGQYEKAIEDFTMAIRNDASNMDLRSERARAKQAARGKDAEEADACLRYKLVKRSGARDDDPGYELRLYNDCPYPVVAMVSRRAQEHEYVLTGIQANPSGPRVKSKTWWAWPMQPAAGETPSQLISKMTFSAVRAETYARDCGAHEIENEKLRCFDRVHAEKAE
jgi:tetratricopeptide (TPR) repeat protein